MAPVATLVVYFNFNAECQTSALCRFKEFAHVIKSGFDITVTNYYPLTFPMWGYGFLMAITNNHIALVLIQMFLAFFSVFLLISTMEHYKVLTKNYILLLKFLLLITIPWYSFHSIRWPYSIASSLLVVSLALLYRATQEKKSWFFFIFSGIAFGVLLNFRSDYILMPLGLASIIWYFKPTVSIFKKTTLWLLCIYSSLIPWAFFAHKVCGHYLLTSTNGGHLCLAGLGKKPNNKWGIERFETDGCPVIHSFVDNVYGKDACTWDYKADQILKKKFIELVYNDPYEYLKKCLLCCYFIAHDGVYKGEFFSKKETLTITEQHKAGKKSKLSTDSTDTPHKSTLFAIKKIINLRSLASYGMYYFFFLLIVLLPVSLSIALFNKNLFFIILFTAVAYQFGMNIFACHHHLYTSNVIFLLLISITYFLSVGKMVFTKIYSKLFLKF